MQMVDSPPVRSAPRLAPGHRTDTVHADKPTLLLRRTIGLKKDEYQLDRKSTSKAEVMSVLESAGFSRSNPYYIVPQGRVRSFVPLPVSTAHPFRSPRSQISRIRRIKIDFYCSRKLLEPRCTRNDVANR